MMWKTDDRCDCCAVNGNDGSLRAGPLRKKRAITNTSGEESVDHPRLLCPEVEVQNASEPEPQGEEVDEQAGPSSSDQPPVIQKRRAWGPYKETVIPAIDPARHRKFVNKLLARNDERATEEELRYGKPPSGKLTYTPLELQVVELKERY